MNHIIGEAIIDFDTNKEITENQFKEFKNKLDKRITGFWEDTIYDLCAEIGFEMSNIHPVMLNEIELFEG